MEIRLLQNLAHPNIVKYLDSIRSDDYLNIILEFVENGALSSLLVKFGGMFPETLCAHYIAQVLKGLHYLHSQGVIHRGQQTNGERETTTIRMWSQDTAVGPGSPSFLLVSLVARHQGREHPEHEDGTSEAG